MSESIEYGLHVSRAMLRAIAEILTEVSRNGLPGEHHFFITYNTTHEDVDMPNWLKESHPEKITIVIQKWYENLVVDGDHGFSVTLNFDNSPVRLFVPFEAISTFIDPFAEFALNLDRSESDGEDEAEGSHDDKADSGDEADSGNEADSGDEADDRSVAKVISLDSFRK